MEWEAGGVEGGPRSYMEDVVNYMQGREGGSDGGKARNHLISLSHARPSSLLPSPSY